MERYSLEWVDKHIDSLIDKLGSDYFPLQIKLDRFETMTYDFIRENTSVLEADQEISDDIKTLMVKKSVVIVKETDFAQKNIWNLPEPADYCRLVSVVPVITDPVTGHDMIKAKKVHIVKEGQRMSYNRDPWRESSAEYPSVYRMENLFKIDVGSDKTTYHKGLITYIKNPVFASINDLDKRIVNLSNIAIEKICLKTADSLRVTTGDATAATNFQFNTGFGKKGK